MCILHGVAGHLIGIENVETETPIKNVAEIKNIAKDKVYLDLDRI